MAYTVLFTTEASKDVKKLDSTVKRQLYKKLLYYVELRDIKIVAKKLHNSLAGEYRLRVGNFRIIFDLDKHTLIILRIQHRKDVYKQ
jgi:mRNA interferase RelE/StbE